MPAFSVIQKHSTVSGVILCSMYFFTFRGFNFFFLLIFSIILFPYVFSWACNEIVYGTSAARDDEILCNLSRVLDLESDGATVDSVGNSMASLCSYDQTKKQGRVDTTARFFNAVMNKYIPRPALSLILFFLLKKAILSFLYLNFSWIKIFLEPDQLFCHIAVQQIIWSQHS